MIELIVYRFAGWQGLFKIPERWCPECDLLIRASQKAIEQSGAPDRVKLIVRPWFLWFWKPLLRGAWHAPILTVSGRVVSQGIVPPVEKIAGEIEKERVGIEKSDPVD
ncbi:MAG: hypothetical protein IH851_08920 [Armatimonadetes bacterium]|nr:hypothetical protein [Armatimonadota bacterium]